MPPQVQRQVDAAKEVKKTEVDLKYETVRGSWVFLLYIYFKDKSIELLYIYFREMSIELLYIYFKDMSIEQEMINIQAFVIHEISA